MHSVERQSGWPDVCVQADEWVRPYETQKTTLTQHRHTRTNTDRSRRVPREIHVTGVARDSFLECIVQIVHAPAL